MLILHTVVDTVMDMFIFDTHTFGSVIDSVLYKVCLQAKEKKICVSANPAYPTFFYYHFWTSSVKSQILVLYRNLELGVG